MLVFEVSDNETGVDYNTLYLMVNDGSGYKYMLVNGKIHGKYNVSISPITNGYRVTYDPDIDFAPQKNVYIRAFGNDIAGNRAYTFKNFSVE